MLMLSCRDYDDDGAAIFHFLRVPLMLRLPPPLFDYG